MSKCCDYEVEAPDSPGRLLPSGYWNDRIVTAGPGIRLASAMPKKTIRAVPPLASATKNRQSSNGIQPIPL
jgi:hypothetical protein